jgi:hypothetical protein
VAQSTFYLQAIDTDLYACDAMFVRWQALTHLSGTRDPLPQSWKNFYLLIETTGSVEAHDKYGISCFYVAAYGFVAHVSLLGV